jgi:hypothetical protein
LLLFPEACNSGARKQLFLQNFFIISGFQKLSTNHTSPLIRVILEDLVVSQLVKKMPAFYAL